MQSKQFNCGILTSTVTNYDWKIEIFATVASYDSTVELLLQQLLIIIGKYRVMQLSQAMIQQCNPYFNCYQL